MKQSQKAIRESTKLYQFELQAHYALLKTLDGEDIVGAVLQNSVSAQTSGQVDYARHFWHGIFQDFQELRNLFPGHAERFGPYA